MDRQEVEWALKVNPGSPEDLDPKEKEDYQVRIHQNNSAMLFNV